jgi:hypothetical protein
MTGRTLPPDPLDALGRWRHAPANNLPVQWSERATRCYAAGRGKGMSYRSARRIMSHWLASAMVSRDAPSWIDTPEPAAAYLIIGADICISLHRNPLGELVAGDIITRGAQSPVITPRGIKQWARASTF